MLLMKKQFQVCAKDIECLCIQCPNPSCKTQIRIPSTVKPIFPDVQGVKSPLEQCVTCGTEFGPGVKHRILAIQQVISDTSSPEISFQVASEVS